MATTPNAQPPSAGPLEELLEKYGDLLRNAIAEVCPKKLGLQFDDIEQEARLRLWKALQGETEIENPASYLYRIALTTTIDAVRRATARREDQLRLEGDILENHGSAGGGLAGTAAEPATAPERSPESLAQRRILLQKVRAALAAVPGDRRRAVGLHLQGFTPPEIATLLSWSEPKARSLVYRGLRDLRSRLAVEGIEYEIG
jgi:RNA polymerase sigma factor (sigma-70 family)